MNQTQFYSVIKSIVNEETTMINAAGYLVDAPFRVSVVSELI